MANNREFWRVQSDQSFTKYQEGHGFSTNWNYKLSRSEDWLTNRMFESHLNWSARPPLYASTPFISVFDNHDDAAKRADLLVSLKLTGVFVAKIVISAPSWTTFWGRLAHPGLGPLPFLIENYSGDGDAAWFVSSIAVRLHLGVNTSTTQESEWFAVNIIPERLITEIEGGD